MKIRRILLIFLTFAPIALFGQCTGHITAFPYKESFEGSMGGWNTGGLNNDWAWGSPNKTVINAAGDGNRCWITGGLTTSFYNFGERSWVESPCFDFTALSKPFISFLVFWDTEFIFDGGNLQYSTDGGLNWETIGTSNDPTGCGEQNWYNHNRINGITQFGTNAAGWSGTVTSSFGSCRGGNGSGEWKRAGKCLVQLAGKPSVKFRFTFGSGTTCNDFDGFAFDDFNISERPAFPADFAFNCSGTRTIQFTDNSGNCNNRWTWNFGDGSAGATASTATHVFAQAGSYTVSMTTGGRCSNDTVISKIVRILGAEVQSTPVSCNNGSDGTLTATVFHGNGSETLVWNGANGTSGQLTGLPVGNYSLTVSGTDACPVTVNAEIIYGPDAFPSVNLGDDRLICPGATIELYPGNYPFYVWDDLSTDSVRKITRGGNYAVEIANNAGCRASDTINVTEDCIDDILVPNTFTPNGDGINDLFSVSGSETESFSMYVYNRWGNLIHQSNDRGGWNGTINGKPAPVGIYAYKIVYKTLYSAAERERTGSILIQY